MFSGGQPVMQFWQRALWEKSCEIIVLLEQWFRRRCHLKKKSTVDRRMHVRQMDGRGMKTDHKSSP